MLTIRKELFLLSITTEADTVVRKNNFVQTFTCHRDLLQTRRKCDLCGLLLESPVADFDLLHKLMKTVLFVKTQSTQAIRERSLRLPLRMRASS